jgi:L-aspartate oxidase
MSRPLRIDTPRHLVSFDLKRLKPPLAAGVVVVGSGLAALRAAIEAAATTRVLVITKREIIESNSRYAQGGIAAAIDERDAFESHIADTLATGWGLSDERVVRTVIAEGADAVREIIAWGAQFDRRDGALQFALEGGHSRARVLHRGDETGLELERTLVRKARSHKNIAFLENCFAVDLLTRGGACRGVLFHDGKQLRAALAGATILATGGVGQIYRETTNPSIATGDGLAMAYRAGAELMDLEFMQFHPTTLYLAGASRALVSEAVRGASGTLRDRNGRAFMKDYHPAGDLAPRDVVSRSMLRQMLKTGDTQVYLDITHIPRKDVLRQFPGLVALCKKFGVDWTRRPIPVRPAAHYMIGGIKSDVDGRTSVPGLYAAGECAATGFHGANRLASNSLLECLVCGRRAGLDAARRSRPKGVRTLSFHGRFQPPDGVDLEDLKNSLRSVMWREVGIERDGKRLAEADERMSFWASYVMRIGFESPAGWELQNLVTVGALMARASGRRTESRGVHYRIDFPKQNDRAWKKHLVVKS